VRIEDSYGVFNLERKVRVGATDDKELRNADLNQGLRARFYIRELDDTFDVDNRLLGDPEIVDDVFAYGFLRGDKLDEFLGDRIRLEHARLDCARSLTENNKAGVASGSTQSTMGHLSL
jgi:hypothetical protein